MHMKMHERVITHGISSLCFAGNMREEGRSPRLLAQSDISAGPADVAQCWGKFGAKDFALILAISLDQVRMVK